MPACIASTGERGSPSHTIDPDLTRGAGVEPEERAGDLRPARTDQSCDSDDLARTQRQRHVTEVRLGS